MSAQTKTTLKGYFNTGDIPTEAQFAELIDTIGQATFTVAASNASDASKGRADYVCDGTNDEVEIQAAIDALPASGGKIVLSEGLFTCAEAGDTANPAVSYCILIDQDDGPIELVGQGWSTILKLADSQDADVSLLLIRGDSGDERAGATAIRYMKIDGNKTGNATVGTHATITPIYCTDTFFDNLWITDPRWCGIHVNLNATRCHVINSLIDASNGKTGLRAEVPYTVVAGNYIKANNTTGSGAGLDLSVNGDIDIPAEYVAIQNNAFEGGVVQCALSGSRRCTIFGNTFTDSTNASGICLSLTSYHHATAGGYDVFDNTIVGNVFSNIRIAIKMVGASDGHECYRNLVANNIITEDVGVNLAYGVWESGDYADNNVILDNIITGATTPISKVGAATRVWGNMGYVTENKGAAASVADGGTIAHGCAAAPTVATVSGSVAGEIVTVTSIDATNITVAIKNNDGSAGTTQTVYWRAMV